MSEGRLSGKVAIVTGAGQGIGEGIARVFAAEGASVVVATRTEKSGQATVDAIVKAGGDAILITVDLGSRAACEAMVADSLAAYGRIDILVHNAAVYPVHLIEDLSDADLDATVDVNLKACFWLTQAVVPTMRAQGGGRLLFTSSVTGPRVAIPGTAHYAATKGAVNGFIRTAALEFRAGQDYRERGRTGLHPHTGARRLGRRRGAGDHGTLYSRGVDGKTGRHRPRHALSGVRRGPLRNGSDHRRRRRLDAARKPVLQGSPGRCPRRSHVGGPTPRRVALNRRSAHLRRWPVQSLRDCREEPGRGPPAGQVCPEPAAHGRPRRRDRSSGPVPRSRS